MSATQQAQAAYGAAARPTLTPRGAEYEAFARITSRLKSVATRQPVDMRSLATAIHDNRRLWAVLAANAAGTDNKLPDRTRAQILSLAEFTRQHSGKVLRARASVIPLIEINAAIMRGLRASVKPARADAP